MTDQEQISGSVAAILDNRELLIDVGIVNGVTIGMRFAILGQVPVTTPNGRKIQVDYAKTIVKIVRFQDDDLSVGRTFRTVPGRRGREPYDPLKAMTVGIMIAGTPDTPPRLETITTDGEKVLREIDNVIHVGDVARQTSDDEFRDTL